jgi:hypothetical protein
MLAKTLNARIMQKHLKTSAFALTVKSLHVLMLCATLAVFTKVKLLRLKKTLNPIHPWAKAI